MTHAMLRKRFCLGVTIVAGAIWSVSAVDAEDIAIKTAPAALSSAVGDSKATGEASGKIEEIVVTARKWSEDVQSIPGSVDVIGSQELAERCPRARRS